MRGWERKKRKGERKRTEHNTDGVGIRRGCNRGPKVPCADIENGFLKGRRRSARMGKKEKESGEKKNRTQHRWRLNPQ